MVPDLRPQGHGFKCQCANANSACHPSRVGNEYQRKLGSKRAYHAMHWPHIRGLAASVGVRLRAKETEIAPPHGHLRLVFCLMFFLLNNIEGSISFTECKKI